MQSPKQSSNGQSDDEHFFGRALGGEAEQPFERLVAAKQANQYVERKRENHKRNPIQMLALNKWLALSHNASLPGTCPAGQDV